MNPKRHGFFHLLNKEGFSNGTNWQIPKDRSYRQIGMLARQLSHSLLLSKWAHSWRHPRSLIAHIYNRNGPFRWVLLSRGRAILLMYVGQFIRTTVCSLFIVYSCFGVRPRRVPGTKKTPEGWCCTRTYFRRFCGKLWSAGKPTRYHLITFRYVIHFIKNPVMI